MCELCLARLKTDSKSSKEVKLFGDGFLQLVDHLFWNLPFTSSKQAHEVREKNNIPVEEWERKWDQIIREHSVAGARDQLLTGWKSWLDMHAESNAGTSGGQARLENPTDCYVEDE